MREFGSPSSRAGALPLPSRILYTVFAFLTLAGCVSCVVIYDGFIHFGARDTPHQLFLRLVEHYDTIDRVKLVETTHAHLFTMPVLLLIAGHLFLMAGASQRIKVVAIVIASAVMTLHLIAPWLIVWSGGSVAGALVYPITGGALLLAMTVLLAVPVWQMWNR
jgi:hypothetical protein